MVATGAEVGLSGGCCHADGRVELSGNIMVVPSSMSEEMIGFFLGVAVVPKYVFLGSCGAHTAGESWLVNIFLSYS